ncbi:hypothetical protein ABZ915_23195 [Streptomyces sp. NPDC046915]|uniref:hypothetical protein n=1 Tax=Streptomyces sp. NPDC046915 TaxID=3155257 RepID=UPI0033CB28D8
MISPSGIPQFTGDFDQLDKDVSALRGDAIGIRNSGMDVHSRFQMLEAYYTAPEADELFATTQPVMDRSDTFATKLETVADALDTYSVEARPLAKKLAQLKADAFAFVDSVDGDDDWTEDEDKVHRHQELLDGVTSAQAAFQDAERRAATKISAIVGGPEFVTDDGSHTVNKKKVMYGYDLGVLEKAKELPWGTAEEQTYEAWSLDWFGHGAKSFVWDGLYKDNIKGGLDGLYTLFGGHGSKAAGDAWSGLKDIVGGIGLYTMTPYDKLMDWAFGPVKDSPDEVRQKKAAKEFAKSLVAWDMWSENPARASATVLFNGLTLGAGPLGAASKASEAGAVAKTAGIAAKVGDFIDPVAVGLRATGKAVGKLPKLSDLTSKIFTGAGTPADAGRVHSVIELEDGSKVVIKDGEFVAYDKHGDLIDDVPGQERSGKAEAAPEQVPSRERELSPVGATSRHTEATGHAGDAHSPQVGRDTPLRQGGEDTPRSAGEASGRAAAGHGVGSDVRGQGSGAGRNGHVGTSAGGRGGEGLDDLGRAGDDGLGDNSDAAHGAGDGAPGRDAAEARPHFMREGSNPYGSRGSLSREQVEEIQVYRANHEPGYFEHYYRKDGTRRSLELYDESGYTPPQLTKLSGSDSLVRAKSVPAPPKPHYLDDSYKSLGADGVTDTARLKALEEVARKRHFAIRWDNMVSDWKAETGRAHDVHGTVDSAAQWGEAKGTYKESHAAMGDAAEEFGEKAAEYHYIAERYPGFDKETLLGPKSGNDQFDQVWTHEDGRVVVVEAKSSTSTELGRRTLDDGRQVSQGSREYFFDIVEAMKARGEFDVVDTLEQALVDNKLEYVVVKGEKNAGMYAGLQYRRFDISKGTLP